MKVLYIKVVYPFKDKDKVEELFIDINSIEAIEVVWHNKELILHTKNDSSFLIPIEFVKDYKLIEEDFDVGKKIMEFILLLKHKDD